MKSHDYNQHMQDLHNLLRARRSVRRFTTDPIPAPVIDRIITTATFAPSAHNLQPWRFTVIQTDLARTALGKALTEKMRSDMTTEGAPATEIEARAERSLRRIDEAPVVILLCRDITVVRLNTPEEHVMAVQSTALAGLQLMLAAYAEGLGSNWVCWPLYAQATVSKALELPETWEPQGMFFLGYANEQPTTQRKEPIILYM
jgi:F420 biosynthesis protein FbiB-like protein